MSACMWIYLGHIEDDLAIEERLTWRFNPNLKEDEFDTLVTKSQEYIFAVYWVLQAITTVGYGDYAGANGNEYLFTLLLEFTGVAFFSAMTYKM